ncbi:unnamed protein product [Linum tenue]|uniref:Uncharacterized protein n=1 Tax=Linum tenue TaxID=586396 RepID=A0AAV0ISE4_9ROSI|nr:unnamed protein product [Linum tenue]CAI0400039.1 unnamed protein product [Linum tenue]CAI0412192.1 unnamed protein product [Linum tenue]
MWPSFIGKVRMPHDYNCYSTELKVYITRAGDLAEWMGRWGY